MKKLLQILFVSASLCSISYAQTYHALNHSQPPQLSVAPIANVNLCPGGSVLLTAVVSGGSPIYTYSWSPSSGLSNVVSDTTTASPTATTPYTVTVTDDRNCTATQNVTVTILDCSGLEEVNFLSSLNIFPNPNNGEFTVDLQFKNKQSKLNIEVVDLTGKLIFTKDFSHPAVNFNTTLNLQAITKGNYLVKFNFSKVSLTRSIIIQ